MMGAARRVSPPRRRVMNKYGPAGEPLAGYGSWDDWADCGCADTTGNGGSFQHWLWGEGKAVCIPCHIRPIGVPAQPLGPRFYSPLSVLLGVLPITLAGIFLSTEKGE